MPCLPVFCSISCWHTWSIKYNERYRISRQPRYGLSWKPILLDSGRRKWNVVFSNKIIATRTFFEFLLLDFSIIRGNYVYLVEIIPRISPSIDQPCFLKLIRDKFPIERTWLKNKNLLSIFRTFGWNESIGFATIRWWRVQRGSGGRGAW